MGLFRRTAPLLIAIPLALSFIGADPPKPPARITRILVKKNAHTMTLYAGEEAVSTYHVAIGPGGSGHKHREGDKVTPVGRYHVIDRGPSQYFTIFMRLDYPNAEDRKRFNELKAKGELPRTATIGGDIGIHGGSLPYDPAAKPNDWTLGCVAVDNDEIKEIAKRVPNWTVVDIED
jgi:murein L,D-transpeptidase YafK